MSGGGRLHASFFDRCNCCGLFTQRFWQLSSLQQTFPNREASILGKRVDTTGCLCVKASLVVQAGSPT